MPDLKFDYSRFDAALRKCIETSSRSETLVVNTHAYHVALAASALTAKVSRSTIAKELGSFVVARGTTTLKLRPGRENEAPLAALIVQARRAAKNQKGLYGLEMTTAITDLLNARFKSVAYLRSGWLPAIRTLAKLADKGSPSPTRGSAQQFGIDAGRAEPAQEGSPDHKAIATIINFAASSSKTSVESGFAGFEREGQKGLDAAMEQETASMELHLYNKFGEVAEEFNRNAA